MRTEVFLLKCNQMKEPVYLTSNSRVLYFKKLPQFIKTLITTITTDRQKKKRKLQPKSKILNSYFPKLNHRGSLSIRHCLQCIGNKTYQNLRILIQIKRKKLLEISKQISSIHHLPRNQNFLKLMKV